jgi:hypothetical protein
MRWGVGWRSIGDGDGVAALTLGAGGATSVRRGANGGLGTLGTDWTMAMVRVGTLGAGSAMGTVVLVSVLGAGWTSGGFENLG